MRIKIRQILNQSEYSAAVGKAYIRQKVLSIDVRSVAVATIAGYQDLSELERGFIVSGREMEHRISEIPM